MVTNNRMFVFSVAGLLAAGAVMASSMHLPEMSAVNPGNIPLTETRQGVQNVVSLLEKSQVAHAAAENDWFRSPSVFGEYNFTDSRDRRIGGFDSDLHSGTLGLNFLTMCDVAISLMSTYGWGVSETEGVGPENLTRNFGLSVTAAKNYDWFLMGVSASYNDNDSRTRTPIGNLPKSFSDGTTLAPFIGAMYVKGNLSLSTVPTYMYNWNWVDYDSTISNNDDHARQQTFVWMNTANYNVSEKVTVSLLANWNRVTHVKQNLNVAPIQADREWLTLGPKVAYHFSPDMSAYASCTRDICNNSFDTLQIVVGMNFGF